MDIRVLLLLAAEALLALALLVSSDILQKPSHWAAAIILTLGAFYIRWLCLDYKTLDYINFLSKWVQFFRDNGGFRALKYSVGNYNIPYLYFLAAFSYSSVSDLYLIKLLSIFFDVLLAWGSMRLVSVFKKDCRVLLASFFTVLFLPTVILNGSLWAQCDSTYASLAVLSIWLAMSDRPKLSIFAITLSFGFKLQAVFVMPILAVFWMTKKFRFRDFLLFPVFYIFLVLPAVFMGRPFAETLLLYFGQTGSIGSGLNYNSPSVFSFFRNLPDEAYAAKLGIIAAFSFMAVVLFLCLLRREHITKRALLAAAILFALGIPFLLPHMHERYFFVADILTVILAFCLWKYAPFAALTQFASLLGYHAYLKMYYLLYMDHGARALIAVLVAVFVLFIKELFFPPVPVSKGKELI